MAVKSHNLDAQGRKVPDEPAPAPGRARGGSLAVAALALAFGVTFWSVGGKYTLDGWVVGLNVLLGFLQVPARIPRPVGWWVLLFIPLALAYSWVEVRARPSLVPRGAWDRWAVAVLLWVVVILSDVGSTFAGVQSPGPRPWPVSVWVAENDPAGGLWSLVLTFAPEALILYGIRHLR